jgi:hypothetical protein
VEVPGFVAYEDPCTLDSASFSPVEVGVQVLEASFIKRVGDDA